MPHNGPADAADEGAGAMAQGPADQGAADAAQNRTLDLSVRAARVGGGGGGKQGCGEGRRQTDGD
jgi:hypothetical protein